MNSKVTKSLEHRFYLIGDGGNAKMDKTTDAMKLLKTKLAKESGNSTVLFLGDNIYPKGMPSKKDDRRTLAEHRLKMQLESLDVNHKQKANF